MTFAPDLLLKGRKEEEEEEEGGEEEEGKEREPLLVPPSGSPAVSASYSGTANQVTLCAVQLELDLVMQLESRFGSRIVYVGARGINYIR